MLLQLRKKCSGLERSRERERGMGKGKAMKEKWRKVIRREVSKLSAGSELLECNPFEF